TLKGNKEHPILAYRNGNLEFVKIKELQVGDYIQTNIYNPNVKTNNQFELRKIVSIKQVEPELVYDLTVQDNENYIANGIVVHNTRWHKDDLIGRLIDTKYNMTHIRLPALYDGLDAYG